MRRQPRNSVERVPVRTQTGGRQVGRRLQIEFTKLQLSGAARPEGNGVGFGAHADPMESRPNVREVRAQGVAKGQTSGARGDDRRLGYRVPGAMFVRLLLTPLSHSLSLTLTHTSSVHQCEDTKSERARAQGRESERARERESERARERESERARGRESERARERESQRESEPERKRER